MSIPEGYILLTKVEYEQLLRDNEQLRKDNEQLRKQIELLMTRIKELEGRLYKNSSNSHKPPSSDGYKKPIRSNKSKGELKQGGQPGNEGHTLQMVKNPDKRIRCKVKGQCKCGDILDHLPVARIERRQEFDLPPKLIEVTEYEVEVKTCTCGHEHVAECPVQASAQYGERIQSLAVGMNQYQMIPYERLQEFFRDYFDVSVSDWWLNKTFTKCYENLASAEEGIKKALMESEVLHSDETGLRVEGKNQWVHVSCTDHYTYLGIHPKRGKEAMDAIGILPHYRGTLVHDRYSSYDNYEDCTHSDCNAHHLRDLQFIAEDMQRQWAKRMRRLLIWVNHLKNTGKLDEAVSRAISARYDLILREALKQEPASIQPIKVQRGRKAKNKSLRFIEMMRQRKERILRFLYDPKVPFDGAFGATERDLRMLKVKQKISGCLRTFKGAQVFCRIRSYISTVKKQGYNVLDAIALALNNQKQPYFALAP